MRVKGWLALTNSAGDVSSLLVFAKQAMYVFQTLMTTEWRKKWRTSILSLSDLQPLQLSSK
jgi:hypothetical protein